MEPDPRAVQLYLEYLNTPLRRRIFLLRLSQLLGSDQKALEMVPILESNYGPNAQTNRSKEHKQ
jgi:hypothetical protein